MSDKYFTIQIKVSGNPDTTEEIKDLTEDHMKQFWRLLWVQGVKIQRTPTSWEVISPFRIISAFVLLQDKKYQL